jgi:hypothetical protein
MMNKQMLADRIIELERALGNPAPSLELYRRQLTRAPRAELVEKISRMDAKVAGKEAHG